ncbi:SHOCT domain-containing protein [uncultured Cohaesibacter sp.]|uniref:SHOCT domain-containing protein n=1 Tax=uncultured Cohaesibacter sp. TaxID=1002546 RepID=UPI0029C64EB7|nr:SHOCT domain-containing protein [uncultured Cohaesibacter sp.]
MIIIFAWILFALIPGFVASSRGNSFFLFFLLSILLSPLVGLIIALLVPSKTISNRGIEITSHAATNVADEIRKLSDLQKDGIITLDEFERKKSDLIGSAS